MDITMDKLILLSLCLFLGCETKLEFSANNRSAPTTCLNGKTKFLKEGPEQLLGPEDHKFDKAYCCSYTALTSCGLTIAACDGSVGALYCQSNIKCISGSECNKLQQWLN